MIAKNAIYSREQLFANNTREFAAKPPHFAGNLPIFSSYSIELQCTSGRLANVR